jgi:hypothetical protein
MLALIGFCLLLSNVLGLSIKITEPSKKTVWRTYEDVDVFWRTDDKNDLGLKTIDLDLWKANDKKNKGKKNRMDDEEYDDEEDGPWLMRNIAFGVDYNHGDSFWTVDPELPLDGDYFIRVTSPDNPKFKVDSEKFTIAKGSPDLKGRIKKSSKTNAGAKLSGPSMGVLMVSILVAAAAVFI